MRRTASREALCRMLREVLPASLTKGLHAYRTAPSGASPFIPVLPRCPFFQLWSIAQSLTQFIVDRAVRCQNTSCRNI